MASGRLGIANLAAAANTTVYTAPSVATINISVCNRNAVAVKVQLAIASAAGAPTTAEYVEYDVTIPASGILERTGLVMSAGMHIVAYSDTANVSVVIVGFEE